MMTSPFASLPGDIVQDMAIKLCQSKEQDPFKMVVYYNALTPGVPQQVAQWQLYIEDVMEYAHARFILEPLFNARGWGI